VAVAPQVFVDGAFYPADEARISVFDHGLLYGDGVFEGIRAYAGRVFRLDRHIDRLLSSARAIDLKVPWSRDDLSAAVVGALRRNGLRDGYVRLVLTRGRGSLGIDPRSCTAGPSIIVIAEPFPALFGDKYERGLQVVTSSVRRMPAQSLPPTVKSLNYLNNILARIEANHRGADEALMLDLQGYVAEGSADNVFIVRGKQLMTPWTSTNLPGITREAVLELAPGVGLDPHERPFTLHEVWAADEVFLTGTAAEVAPVAAVDGRTIGQGGPGPRTREVAAAFRTLVGSEGTPI